MRRRRMEDESDNDDYKIVETFLSWALAIGSYFFPSFLASESSLTSTCEEEEEEDSSSQKQEVLEEERMQE